MQEAIFRRFKHAEREKLEIAERGSTGNKEEGKFTRLPDLILADGGLGHVNAVSSVLKDLGLAIPVWGMVKDDRHRTRGLVAKTGEIDLSKHPAAFRLVTAIQDEAHRFALDYNKRLRKKRMTGSALDEIGGIGEKRRKALIRHFGSINAIKAAGVDDLLAVDSMNKIAAQKVYDYFHN
jgi:excinuclease ABC subunit C